MRISIAIIFAFILTCNLADAQILGGFFSQQQTKIKTMLEQIVAYETTLHELKNGYSVAQHGLSSLHDLKNGTFTLHQNYFNSLAAVAPAVKNNPKIKGTTDLLDQVEETFDNALIWQKDKKMLSADEIAYMQKVYSHLLDECNKDIDELSLVTTDGKMQMKDEERISKLDKLYAGMEQKYSFARSFCDKGYAIAYQRNADKAGNLTLKKLYDLN